MIGASAVAVATLSTTARADGAPAKWLPNISVSAQGGDDLSGAKVTEFDPIWQDLNSLLYARLGFGTLTSDNMIASGGLGYRAQSSAGWIMGLYGGFDFTKTRYSHSFTQASLGAEAMSANWDLRVNGYVTLDQQLKDIAGSSGFFLQGTQIALLKGQVAAYSGVDGEVGYRVYNTDDIDVRLFAGGFTFGSGPARHSSMGQSFKTGPQVIAGPMGRAEIELYNLHRFGVDLFGSQSRLTLSGEVSHDDVRGTTGYAGVSLQIPIGGSDADEDQDELDRRMVDPVRRQDYVLTEKTLGAPEPVIISNGHITSQPTNTVYYVDNTTGAGTYTDPTTLHDATARGPVNQFVVLTDRQGTVNAAGVTVKTGETVVGPGTFTVRGTISGQTFTHDFAPHSGPVTITSSDPNVITLKNNVSLYGFTIAGPFTNAIYGHNVTGVHLSGLTISGGGTGQNGVYFHDDDGTSTNISVDNSTVTGVTQDGIKLQVDNGTGTTASATVNLTSLTVSAGQYGVAMNANVSGGSQQTTYLGVHNSTLSGGATGLSDTGIVAAGSTLSQNVVVDPTHVAGGVYNGIALGVFAYGGTATQTIALNQVYVSGAQRNGIQIYADATSGGTVHQTVSLDTVSVTGGRYGISAVAVALSNASASQTITADRVAVSGAAYGMLFDNVASATSGAHQYLTLSNVTLSGSSYANLRILESASTGSVADQTATLDAMTATGAGDYNIYIRGIATGGGTAHQSASLSNVSATGASTFELTSHAGSYSGGVTDQTVALSGVTASGAIADNIVFGSYAVGGGTTTQTLTLTGVSASAAKYDDVRFIATSYHGTTHQYATVTDLAASNSLHGNGVYADANGFYGTVLQQLDFHHLGADGNSLDGIRLALPGISGITTQAVTLDVADLQHNGADGIDLVAAAHAGGHMTQILHVNDATAAYNGGDGLHAVVSSYSYSGGAAGYVTQAVNARNVVFSHNTGYGVSVRAVANYGSQLASYVTLSTSHADSNGGSGVSVSSLATTGAYIYQATSLTGLAGNLSSADGNGHDGVVVSTTASGATVQQYVDLFQASASSNHGDGVYVHAYAGNQPAASVVAQYIYVGAATLSHNATGGGIRVIQQARGATSYSEQLLYLYNSQVSSNYSGGVTGFEAAYSGGAVRQSAYLTADTIASNTGTGIYMGALAVGVHSTAGQAFFSGPYGAPVSNVTGNSRDGVYLEAEAFQGAQTEQFAVVYGVNASYNGRDGVRAFANPNGYGFGIGIYYSTVGQGIIAAYSTMSHNQENGLRVTDVNYYGGVLNQLVYAVGDHAEHNTGAGLYLSSGMTTIRGNSFSFTTNAYVTLRATGDRFDYNGGDGIEMHASISGPVYAPAFFGGYSHQIEKTYITGVDASHNAGSGLYVSNANRGRYGDSYNLVTIGTSTFDNNAGAGALFLSSAYYGAGGLGKARQHLGITASDFSYNAVDGLKLEAEASGRQGDAEQYVTVTGTGFTHNGGDGLHVYSSAVNGTYAAGHPCTAVYNVASGCAFVRQGVLVYSSHLDHNNGNGVFVGTYANGYGAIYGAVGRPHAATLELYQSTASYNNARGLDISDHTSGHSYLYQSALLVAGHLDHNGSDGVYSASYIGGASHVLQQFVSAAGSMSNNAGNGFKSTVEALGSSYASDSNDLRNLDFSHNGGFGVDFAIAYADGSSTGKQHNVMYADTMNYNADGIGNYSIGPGSSQKTFIHTTEVAHNPFVGVYGEANFGAYQYIDVYTTGNNVHNNGTNYLFNSFGGSTQILH